MHFQHDPKITAYWKLLFSWLCVSSLEAGGTHTCVRNKGLPVHGSILFWDVKILSFLPPMFLEHIANQLQSAKQKSEKNLFEKQCSLPPPLGYTTSDIFVSCVLKHPCVISVSLHYAFLFFTYTNARDHCRGNRTNEVVLTQSESPLILISNSIKWRL